MDEQKAEKRIRLRNIILKWSYPVLYESILGKDIMGEIGIYYISRKFGNNDTLLYIGKTHSKFYDRLKSHKDWIEQYRGRIFIRVGLIESPQNYDNQLIVDVESALIYEAQPIINIDKKNSYHYTYECQVHNVGYRGELPTIVSMRNH